jgi:hypothetical protein
MPNAAQRCACATLRMPHAAHAVEMREQPKEQLQPEKLSDESAALAGAVAL